MNFVVYDDSGVILRCGFCSSADIAMQAGMNENYVFGKADDLTHYIDVTTTPHTIKNRIPISINVDTLSILADGLDTATITNVPQDVYITWPDGVSEVVTDGVIEFAVNQPGTYTLVLSGVKYIDEVIEIEASI